MCVQGEKEIHVKWIKNYLDSHSLRPFDKMDEFQAPLPFHTKVSVLQGLSAPATEQVKPNDSK